MKKCNTALNILYFVFLTAVICQCANCTLLITDLRMLWLMPVCALVFPFVNLAPSLLRRKISDIAVKGLLSRCKLS